MTGYSLDLSTLVILLDDPDAEIRRIAAVTLADRRLGEVRRGRPGKTGPGSRQSRPSGVHKGIGGRWPGRKSAVPVLIELLSAPRPLKPAVAVKHGLVEVYRPAELECETAELARALGHIGVDAHAASPLLRKLANKSGRFGCGVRRPTLTSSLGSVSSIWPPWCQPWSRWIRTTLCRASCESWGTQPRFPNGHLAPDDVRMLTSYCQDKDAWICARAASLLERGIEKRHDQRIPELRR